MESDVDLEAMSAAPRYLEGYPTFAEFIAKDKDAAIYRRFENLRARNLLYLQDELHELERKLEELDEKDAKGMMSFVAHIYEPWLKLDGRAHHTDRPGTSTSKFATPSGNKVAKIKRGLPGFVNGSRTSALADTGAAQNIVSAAFAQEKGVSLGGQAAVFRLGNNKKARSIGTVKLRWAFAEKPTELYDIVCHVLPHCTYDMILGSSFMKETETFSKHLHRLVKCAFNVFDVYHLSFLDGGRQTLFGEVGGYPVFAIPGTGAERNVMDLDYAEAFGFKINTGPRNRGFLEFADGTFQETVGQVETTWTFASGLKIPVTFEILENCSADVILGENMLWENSVFKTYSASIREMPYMPYEDEADELFELAPFSYKKKWQQKASDFKQKILSKSNQPTQIERILEQETLEQLEADERQRRDQWNHQHGFHGANASAAETAAEAGRRRQYNARLEALRIRPPCPEPPAPAHPIATIAELG